MPRIGTCALWVLAAGLVVAEARGAAAVPASETLLPDTTKGFLCVTNAQTLSERWNKTDLGQLANDPVMKPFAEDLRHQFDERLSDTREKLGVTIEDMRGVPGGAVTTAAVQPKPGEAAVVLLVDVTGHEAQAAALLTKVSANLLKRGAKQRQLQSSGVAVTIFDLPPSEDRPGRTAPEQAVFVLQGNLFVAADHLGVVQGIVARLSGQKGATLADVASFQAVMKRCQKDAKSAVPQIRWYVQPIGYLEIVQVLQAERQRRPKGRSLLEAFKKQGFGAIQGVGGYVELAVEKFQILHRTAIYAPPPYQGAMKALSFPNGQQFAPQGWVPRDIAAYATFYADVLNAFDSFGPLFDELYNEGQAGLWEEVLRSMRDDPNGPRIDLREELISQLGRRITVLTDYQVPITTTSERLLFAIEAKDEKAVAAALAKLFKNDAEMRRRELAGRVIWESVPAEKSTVPSVSLDLPNLGPEGTASRSSAHESGILPNQAITAAHGHLLIASHYDFLAKILQTDQKETLSRAIDYQIVTKLTDALGMPAHSAATFTRTDEAYRPTYELIRQGKMPESETLFARLLNTVSGAGKKGVVRKQKIEGSKMPDYDYVRRYLGPAGGVVASEPEGWFIKGFMLGKQQ